MEPNVGETLKDLRAYVAGRGHEKNFCYSKVYSLSSSVRCVDFSPWVGSRILKNDIQGLSVFKAQLDVNRYISTSITFHISDDGDVSDDEFNNVDGNYEEESDDEFYFRLEENKREYIKPTIQLQLENYFLGEIENAKVDILTALLLEYHPKQIARILTPYNLSFKNQDAYLKNYATRKKQKLELPSHLPTNPVFGEFQHELRRLPLATRLHVFDILKYSSFNKKPKPKMLSDMTLYETRVVGIDENESANILKQSKLIESLPDGTGFISPQFIEAMSIAYSYADKIEPVYKEWVTEIDDLMIDQLSSDLDDSDT